MLFISCENHLRINNSDKKMSENSYNNDKKYNKTLFLNFCTSAWFGSLVTGKWNLLISNCTELLLQREQRHVIINLESKLLRSLFLHQNCSVMKQIKLHIKR